MKIKNLKNYIFTIIIVISAFILQRMMLATVDPYAINNDTPTYMINSLRQLGAARNIGYQLILYFTNLFLHSEDRLYRVIVLIQMLIAAVGVGFVFDTAKIIFKKKWIQILIAIQYMMITVFDLRAQAIMTESLSMSITCIQIWCIARLIDDKKSIWVHLGNALLVIHVSIRPSGIYLYPILLVFYTLFCIKEKYGKKYNIQIALSYICAILGLVFVCSFNLIHNNVFSVGTVSYHNQAGEMLEAELIDNDRYPDVSQRAHELLEICKEDKTYLDCGIKLCQEFGYKKMSQYLADTRKKYLIDYSSFIYTHKVYPALNDNIMRLNDQIRYNIEDSYEAAGFEQEQIIKILMFLLMPYSFIQMFGMCILWLLVGIGGWIVNRKPNYIIFGIPACVITIMFVTFVSLIEASPQRIGVCILPFAVLIHGFMIDCFACSLVRTK